MTIQHIFLKLEDAKNFKEQSQDILYKNYKIHMRTSTSENGDFNIRYFCKNLYIYWSPTNEYFYEKFDNLDKIKRVIDEKIRLQNIKDKVIAILLQ